MGAILRRRFWRAAAPLFALADRAYRRWHGLEEIGGILYAGRARWRGQPRRLADGTAVAPGDPILWLHLNSQLAAADTAGASSPAGAGRRFARRFLPACAALARRLQADPGWSDVVAIHGIAWIGPYVGERWGFEFERLPDGLGSRFARWHMRNLMAVADPESRRRELPWPFEIWISSRRLCERFGGGRAPS